MNNIKISLASPDQLPQVLGLHLKYHKDTVGISKAGFLTCRFTIEELATFQQQIGIVVATAESVVVGYSILMTIQETLKRTDYHQLIYTYQNLRPDISIHTIVLARQYCVEDGFRKGGVVVKSIFEQQRVELRKAGYKRSIGEIDSRNRASLVAAQRMLGYRKVGCYHSDGIEWVVVDRVE